jgi:uncharacterized protein involved in response to NO
MLLQIEKSAAPPPTFALLELGFRPFFSVAGLFAVLSVSLWMAIYVFSASRLLPDLGGVLWHGHEMVFGYAMAVIAGFLLTAVGNWTRVPGLRGSALFGLVLAWVIARIAFFVQGESAQLVAAVADCVFVLGLILGVGSPVVRVKQWRQLGVIAVLCLLLLSNVAFHAGALGCLANGTRWGLYSGLYLILLLMFVMARRVVPFFIERGVGERFAARNRRWVDIGSVGVFVAWAILDVFFRQSHIVAWLSVLLAVLHLVRLRDWYTPGIWKAPLLWSLYLGYGFLVLGFVLKAQSVWLGSSPTLSLHAFTYGGIGLVTLGMMSRVALGHTGRNVFDPPKVLGPMFMLLVLGTVIRVIAPLLDVAHYTLWIGISQALWILGFGWFSAVYLPILARPRIDGRPG